MCSFVVGGGDTILASHAVVCDVYALMHVNVNSCVCVCVCVCALYATHVYQTSYEFCADLVLALNICSKFDFIRLNRFLIFNEAPARK